MFFFGPGGADVRRFLKNWKPEGGQTKALFPTPAYIRRSTMIDIKPNLAQAVAFAVSLPTDQMHLCAIHPAGNRPVVGRSFPKTEAGQAAALRWLIEAARKVYGIYSNANEVNPLCKSH